ncbi:MAG: indole-3-glycerol-phosphate synthase [Deltaproteobacteria bacterium]|nr:indole-3-glycerol-phosphate synthase [Deltaproteobacteria bacterium]
MKGTHLDALVGAALQQLAVRATMTPLPEIIARARDAGPVRPFAQALKGAAARGSALIAEVKRKSPSKGDLNPDLHPATLAAAYERGGAACLSVLTDGVHFGGSLVDLVAARAATAIPVLRKDFIVTPYQLHEARVHGADAVLLIAAALEPKRLRDLRELARELSLTVLIEVHDDSEVESARAAEPELLGINARSLKTLVVDSGTFARVAPLCAGPWTLVAESGVRTPDDVRGFALNGAQAFLVGEALSTATDPESATRTLVNALTKGA